MSMTQRKAAFWGGYTPSEPECPIKQTSDTLVYLIDQPQHGLRRRFDGQFKLVDHLKELKVGLW